MAALSSLVPFRHSSSSNSSCCVGRGTSQNPLQANSLSRRVDEKSHTKSNNEALQRELKGIYKDATTPLKRIILEYMNFQTNLIPLYKVIEYRRERRNPMFMFDVINYNQPEHIRKQVISKLQPHQLTPEIEKIRGLIKRLSNIFSVNFEIFALCFRLLLSFLSIFQILILFLLNREAMRLRYSLRRSHFSLEG